MFLPTSIFTIFSKRTMHFVNLCLFKLKVKFQLWFSTLILEMNTILIFCSYLISFTTTFYYFTDMAGICLLELLAACILFSTGASLNRLRINLLDRESWPTRQTADLWSPFLNPCHIFFKVNELFKMQINNVMSFPSPE